MGWFEGCRDGTKLGRVLGCDEGCDEGCPEGWDVGLTGAIVARYVKSKVGVTDDG